MNIKLFENVDNLGLILKQFIKEKIDKDTYLYQQGDEILFVYILLKGKIEISKYDISGNKIIVTIIKANEMFAESVALSNNNRTPFNIKAIENCEIIKIEPEKLLKISPKIIFNLMKITSDKNILLAKKISCISQNTIQKRVYEYFKILSIEQGKLMIEVPLNKLQLAAYLCVDRSALSRELKKMETDGFFKQTKHGYGLNVDVFGVI